MTTIRGCGTEIIGPSTVTRGVDTETFLSIPIYNYISRKKTRVYKKRLSPSSESGRSKSRTVECYSHSDDFGRHVLDEDTSTVSCVTVTGTYG